MSLAMPFIDNDLLWCPDNDGKMVDLSSCLQDAASVAVGQQTAATGGLGELSQSDLSSLVPAIHDEPGPMNDTEDIFKQLSETNFEIDNFLNEFNANDIKQEENNNNIPNSNQHDHNVGSTNGSKSAQVMVEMRSLKFTIAAANPLLAEKLATPSGQQQQQLSGNQNGRPQMAPLIPKIEKGPVLGAAGSRPASARAQLCLPQFPDA